MAVSGKAYGGRLFGAVSIGEDSVAATASELMDWKGMESPVAKRIEKESNAQLRAYKEHPPLVEEHANLELAAFEAGYKGKQLYELVQNAADELVSGRGRIHVVLTDSALYCANEGAPFSPDGAATLLGSHVSRKGNEQIGRFGLGFKSVLEVSDRPQIFSRSGSFGFDKAASREAVVRKVGEVPRAPVLRYARALDPRREAARDEVLATLMAWAATVIRLPLNGEDLESLQRSIDDFPAEFLIFADHVAELDLDDRVAGNHRTITVDRGDRGALTLSTGRESSEWRVFSGMHEPGDRARADGGYSVRETGALPIHWAVSKERLGRLWAFFPTRESMTTSGILNAPWKLDPNRQFLVPGAYNDELLRAAVDVMLEHLGDLVDKQDPGGLVDVFPAMRTKEARGDADRAIGETFYEKARLYPSLPDTTGELQLPASLKLHPEKAPVEAIVAWGNSPFVPSDWCHPTIDTKGRRQERRAKAARLVNEGGGRQATMQEWLEALIDEEHPVESSKRALLVAQYAANGSEGHIEDILEAKIVVDEHGELVEPAAGRIFLPPTTDIAVDVPLVHPEIASDAIFVAALRDLGVAEVSSKSLLDAALGQASCRKLGADWSEIWKLARGCERAAFEELLAKHEIARDHVSVRNRQGRWARLFALVIPGEVLLDAELGPDDDRVVLDTAWHSADLQVLRRFGASTGPVEGRGSVAEPWFAEYRKEVVARYLEGVHGKKPSPDVIEIEGIGEFAGPVSPLRCLSPVPAARFATEALRRSPDFGWVELRHRTLTTYPRTKALHPLAWLVRESGVVLTSLGVMPLDKVVGPELDEFRSLLAIAQVSANVSHQLGFPRNIADLSEGHWELAHRVIARIERREQLVEAYGQLAGISPAPDEIRAVVSGKLVEAPPAEVAVARDDRAARLLESSGKPYLATADERIAGVLIERWGLREATDLIDSELAAIPSGEPEALTDRFPMLAAMLDESHRHLQVTPCSELRRDYFTDSGRVSEVSSFDLSDDEVFYLDTMSDAALLGRLSTALGLGLDESDAQTIIDNKLADEARRLTERMRKASSDGARLLEAVPAETLRARLPHELVAAYEDFHGEPDDQAIADLTLAAFGYETLAKLRGELEAAGLQPPAAFAGSRRAIQFVRDLGFERGYAGFKGEGREEALEIEGRVELPELHAYQRTAADAIKVLISGRDGLRGLLSLPTGAGKTRVSVQAIVEAMSHEDGLPSPVLWIAQTDELCEQAVQSWAEVWRALGPARPLRISRLWASNAAEPVDEGDQVVVATDAKLGTILKNKQYDWLKSATCVVVDEAHTSTTAAYTAILSWLGMGGGKERAPLIGLSATPFRGSSEGSEQTDTLAARYGRRRLDFGAFADEPTISNLQDLGILARVEHRVLEGANVPLSDDELKQLRDFRRLPPSVLNRLGEDVDRNRRLVNSILELSDDWPVLVFGTSVAHAQTLAALLTREGRRSASVSGETKASVRRYMIDRFKRGEIKVLVNYNVLTQGFDAPSVRALYIARPTYTPNRYQQMVGRGLRGPLNGGKPECLVVNVADNLERFADELAFRGFDHLWSA